MDPIEETMAEKWEKRFAIAYMVVGWNALAFIFYQVYFNDLKLNKEESLAERLVRKGEIKNVTVYKFENLSYVGPKELDYKELKKAKDTREQQQAETSTSLDSAAVE